MKKSKLLGLSIIIALAVSLISPAVALGEGALQASARARTILIDRTHGEGWALTDYISSLEAAGYVVNNLTSGPVTEPALSGYDAFLVITPETIFSSDEVSAITSYVSNGGGLYLVGDYASAYVGPLNSIAVNFGVTFNSGNTLGWQNITNIASHPVTKGVSKFQIWAAPPLNPVSPPSVSLAWASRNETVLAVAEYDSGRVVCYVDATVLHNNYWPERLSEDDIELQMNIIDWLSSAGIAFQYSFRLNPFIDVIHMNVTPGGWLNGICETPSYSVPVLGKYEGGMAYIACDLPAGGIEMALIVISIPTRDGYEYRIYDDLSLIGPTYVWLTPVAQQSTEGPTQDEATGSQVTPKAWYTFQVNPWINIYHLNTDLAPWLWGYSEPEPVDPILGYRSGGRFFLATDFIPDGGGGLELSFKAGTIASRDGYSIRTTDGTSYIGPDYFWLTPV